MRRRKKPTSRVRVPDKIAQAACEGWVKRRGTPPGYPTDGWTEDWLDQNTGDRIVLIFTADRRLYQLHWHPFGGQELTIGYHSTGKAEFVMELMAEDDQWQRRVIVNDYQAEDHDSAWLKEWQ